MDYVNGQDRILFIKFNGIYMPVGCLTGNGLEESTELLPTTTRDNEGWETDKALTQSYTVSFTGLQVNSTLPGGNFGVASYDRLKIVKRSRVIIEWKLQGTVYPVVDYGKGIITDISSSENVGEFMTFSGNIKGFGKPLVQELGGVLLNNGDPNIIINSGNEDELIKVS